MKRAHTRIIGLRTLKTALAVCLVIVIYIAAGLADPTLACIAALLCMQDSVKKTIAQGVQRVLGTLIGGAAGLAFAFINIERGYLSAFAVMLFIAGLIVFCNLAQRPDYIAMACITFLSIAFSTSVLSPLVIALQSTADSLAGIVVAVVVNRLLLDPERFADKPYGEGALFRTGGAYYVIIDGTRVLLVNKTYSVRADFADGPDPVAAAALDIMFASAAEQGVSLFVVSGFRSHAYQRRLYAGAVKTRGDEHAGAYNAKAGHSEHETGLAFDLNGRDKDTVLREEFCETPEYKWLCENAATFGFIERYNRGKTAVTGYAFEPWHFRYVGVTAAKKIVAEGLSLEEFVKQS